MYKMFFGLSKDPFGSTPDPSMLYLTASHRDALAGLAYAVVKRKGFVVLTGDAGTGKTTLLSRVIQTVSSSSIVSSVILNSARTASEFLESVLIDFGLGDLPESRALRFQKLQHFLMSEHSNGRTCLLVLDEAQTLPEEVLEEVRLLSNCELPDQKLLQIVLSGQSELDGMLERQSLRQLKQRVACRFGVNPLARHDIPDYVRFRWGKAGGCDPAPFTPAALEGIMGCSGGIPRTVNILCDNALLLAFCEGARSVSMEHVAEAARSLILRPDATAAAATAGAPRTNVAPAAALVNPGNATVPEPMPTLRRYAAAVSRKSWLSRCAAKLPWTQHVDGVA